MAATKPHMASVMLFVVHVDGPHIPVIALTF
jgi:hypothetical protein